MYGGSEFVAEKTGFEGLRAAVAQHFSVRRILSMVKSSEEDVEPAAIEADAEARVRRLVMKLMGFHLKIFLLSMKKKRPLILMKIRLQHQPCNWVRTPPMKKL